MYPGVRKYLWMESLRNHLDICSKVVCFRLDWAEALIREIREELRQEIVGILHEPLFFKKEKLKFIMILYAWPVYISMLPRWKQFFAGNWKYRIVHFLEQ